LGQAVIEKTLITTNPVIATGQEVKWKITIIASGGSIKDFQIKDILPVELTHVTSKVLLS
jgi:hypothetical protein